jgi:murein DD-endopeptidase MepM/ murein hydrolase activator NlpD
MKRTFATLATVLAVAGTTSFVVVGSNTERPVVAADSQSDSREDDHTVSRSETRQPLVSEVEQMAIDKRANQKAIAAKQEQERIAAERAAKEKAAQIAAQKEANRKAALAVAAEKARKVRQQNFKPAVTKPRSSTPVVNSSPKQYALSRLGATQYNCFNNIVIRESGWNYTATNPSSGAYGLVQALPGSKMASAGADWRTNPITQINWGISYMNGRYGSPCGAWNFWLNNHWY